MTRFLGLGSFNSLVLLSVHVLPNGLAWPSLDPCPRKTTNETLNSHSFMPELLARKKLLCGHRLGAAGSPENLIGADRASSGDNNLPFTGALDFRILSCCFGVPHGLGRKPLNHQNRILHILQATALLDLPPSLVQLDCLSALQPQKETERISLFG